MTRSIPGKKKVKISKRKTARICRVSAIFCCESYAQLKIHGRKGDHGWHLESRGSELCNAILSSGCIGDWAGMHKGAAGFHLLHVESPDSLCNAHGFSSWSFFVPPLWIQIAECGNHVVASDCISHKTSLCNHHWGEYRKFREIFAKIIWIFSLSSTTLCKSKSRADFDRGGQSKQLLFYYPDMFNFFPPFFRDWNCRICPLQLYELYVKSNRAASNPFVFQGHFSKAFCLCNNTQSSLNFGKVICFLAERFPYPELTRAQTTIYKL